MEVICLETKAFYDLVEKVVKRIKGIESNEKHDKWVSEQEAMRLLRVTSKITISKLSSNGMD
ncbi:hypothetical protein [Maribacter litoralis]|uniref:hypothetical protein n=1 Tax=Maribacter litoralis TaxID=2059726 RepID=UPI003F5CCA79